MRGSTRWCARAARRCSSPARSAAARPAVRGPAAPARSIPGAPRSNAKYTPTAAEIAAGGVTLTLVSIDPAGPCGPANDPMRITINAAATANAGADQVVCATSPLVQLAGSVGGGAASGTWSGGAGTFNPGRAALECDLPAEPGEIAAGGVTLTLDSNDPAGPCGAVSDQVRITINPAAIVERRPRPDRVRREARRCSSPARSAAARRAARGAAAPARSARARRRSTRRYTPTRGRDRGRRRHADAHLGRSGRPCGPVSRPGAHHDRSAHARRRRPRPGRVRHQPAARSCTARSPARSTGGTWSGGGGSFSPGASDARMRSTRRARRRSRPAASRSR